jgi:hypothetical protein
MNSLFFRSCSSPQADIKEMAGKSYYDMSTKDKIEPWEIVSKCKVSSVSVSRLFIWCHISVEESNVVCPW